MVYRMSLHDLSKIMHYRFSVPHVPGYVVSLFTVYGGAGLRLQDEFYALRVTINDNRTGLRKAKLAGLL